MISCFWWGKSDFQKFRGSKPHGEWGNFKNFGGNWSQGGVKKFGGQAMSKNFVIDESVKINNSMHLSFIYTVARDLDIGFQVTILESFLFMLTCYKK